MQKEKKNSVNCLTRERLLTALMQLLKSKSLSAISITELTEQAGVSRMTYYRNYTSKEDILSSHLKDIFSSYRRDIASWKDQGCYNDYRNLLHCFEYFYQHREFMKSLVSCHLEHWLLCELSSYLMETYYRDSDSIDLYYRLQAFSGALYHTYISWILNDTRETPEEMARLMAEIFS